MPKFTQIAPVAVRVTDPGSVPPVQHDVVEVFALGDDGKVYRFIIGHAGGWHQLE